MQTQHLPRDAALSHERACQVQRRTALTVMQCAGPELTHCATPVGWLLSCGLHPVTWADALQRHCAGVALDDLVYICTKIARQMDTNGLDKVFDAAETATAAIEEARPLLENAVKLVDEVRSGAGSTGLPCRALPEVGWQTVLDSRRGLLQRALTSMDSCQAPWMSQAAEPSCPLQALAHAVGADMWAVSGWSPRLTALHLSAAAASRLRPKHAISIALTQLGALAAASSVTEVKSVLCLAPGCLQWLQQLSASYNSTSRGGLLHHALQAAAEQEAVWLPQFCGALRRPRCCAAS